MNIANLKNNLELCVSVGVVPMIWGMPAIGKSQCVKQLADKLGAYLIDLRLAQMASEDLAGLVYPNEEQGTFSYLPLDLFPLKGIVDKPKKPIIIFLDEISACVPEVQVAAYRLVLDRQVGEYELHDNVSIICAGNRESDNAVVQPMSTALVSRMVHFTLDLDLEGWVKWGHQNGIDSRILAFMNYSSNNLSTFSAFEDSPSLTYASPRTWEMASDLISKIPSIDFKYSELICGTVGDKAGSAFISYCAVYSHLPTLSQILANPLGISVSNRGDINIAVVTNLNGGVNRTNIKAICSYVNRLALEFQTLFYQTLCFNNKILLASQPVRTWISNNPDLFNND